MAKTQEPARTLDAMITYVDPDAPIGAHHDYEPEKTTLKMLLYPMQVRDARPLAGELDLESNGFVLLRRPSAVRSFDDPEAIKETYFAEARAIITELTGAERVVVFGMALRNGDPNAPRGTRAPAYTAHVDYNTETMLAAARKYLTPDEVEKRLSGRIMVINIWRPITPVERDPLAVCDARSVERRDLIHGPIGGQSVSGIPNAAGFNLAHNPGHRWHYVSAMQPDEVLVFKLCDTDTQRVQWTAHTAFDDPTSPRDAKPRRSIEVRTLAFLPR